MTGHWASDATRDSRVWMRWKRGATGTPDVHLGLSLYPSPTCLSGSLLHREDSKTCGLTIRIGKSLVLFKWRQSACSAWALSSKKHYDNNGEGTLEMRESQRKIRGSNLKPLEAVSIVLTWKLKCLIISSSHLKERHMESDFYELHFSFASRSE